MQALWTLGSMAKKIRQRKGMQQLHKVDSGCHAWSCQLRAGYRKAVDSTAHAAHLHPENHMMVLYAFDQG